MPRVQGSKGFTNSEIRLVLKEILTVLPRSAEDWKKVYENCKTEVSNFNFQHPDRPLSFRKQETLRRKYSDMIALSKKKDSNLIGDKEYIRLCHIASSIHTLCVIRSPEKTNAAITDAEVKKKQQEIMLSLQYDNYYNQGNFGLGDFGLEDENKLNLFQLSQHRQFIQQFQRPIQPKLDNSKILSGSKIMESGSYSSGSGKSSPIISSTLEQSGIEANNEGIALSQYQDELQNKKRGTDGQTLSPYNMSKRIKYGNTDDSLSMLMQTAINQNNISNTSLPQDIEFLDNGENNIGVREQLRYIMSVVESIHRKIQNIENQLYKVDVITNHLDILESKIYLLSASKNDPKVDDKKKKNSVTDSLFNGNASTSKTLSLAKNVVLNKINNSIAPTSVSKLVSSSLDTIGVNSIKSPIQLSPKSRGRVQFFEDTFGLKLNLSGKLDPDFSTSDSKVSNMILLPETMENLRQFRKDYGNYLTPKSLERINEFEAQYAKTNALNSELFKTVSALGAASDAAAAAAVPSTSVLGINGNKLETELPTTSTNAAAADISSLPLINKVNVSDDQTAAVMEAKETAAPASDTSVNVDDVKDNKEGEEEEEEEQEEEQEQEQENEEEEQESQSQVASATEEVSTDIKPDIKVELEEVAETEGSTEETSSAIMGL